MQLSHLGWFGAVRRAAALALAVVLAFAAVIAGLAAALTFTIVLAFARVFVFIFKRHSVHGYFSGIGTTGTYLGRALGRRRGLSRLQPGRGAAEKAGYSSRKHHGFH